MNKAILMGNLCKDPETRTTPSGKQVASCSLATNKRYKDQQGQMQTVSQFHNLVVWGNSAAAFAQYLKKGSKVLIEGEISNRSYEGQDGVKKYVSEIIVDKFEFLDSKPAENKPVQSAEELAKQSLSDDVDAGAQRIQSEKDEIKIEDIPF